jgi:hypothetical protein
MVLGFKFQVSRSAQHPFGFLNILQTVVSCTLLGNCRRPETLKL